MELSFEFGAENLEFLVVDCDTHGQHDAQQLDCGESVECLLVALLESKPAHQNAKGQIKSDCESSQSGATHTHAAEHLAAGQLALPQRLVVFVHDLDTL